MDDTHYLIDIKPIIYHRRKKMEKDKLNKRFVTPSLVIYCVGLKEECETFKNIYELEESTVVDFETYERILREIF